MRRRLAMREEKRNRGDHENACARVTRITRVSLINRSFFSARFYPNLHVS